MPAQNPIPMTTTSPVTTRSNARESRRLFKARSSIETTPVMMPPTISGRWNSSCSPIAPPTTSATSVAIATSSACTQNAVRAGRFRMLRPSSSGRLAPVITPSFAERYWTSHAMTFATTTTHTSR